MLGSAFTSKTTLPGLTVILESGILLKQNLGRGMLLLSFGASHSRVLLGDSGAYTSKDRYDVSTTNRLLHSQY